jgi:tRNA threonylcarbamoyladenosine biosynthesis protein TsaE
VARKLSPLLEAGDIVCLFGDLGAGKTVFAKGLAAGLGIAAGGVTSPSFVLMHVHAGGRLPLYHFDFYRLNADCQIAETGYEEFMYADGVAAIEWPQRLDTLMPREYLEVRLTAEHGSRRAIHFAAHGARYARLLKLFGASL